MGMKVVDAVAHQAITVYTQARLQSTGLKGTGLTLSVQASKNGGALAGIAGAVAELGASGVYKIDLTTADTNTPGTTELVITEATIFDETITVQVKGIPDFTVGSVNDGSPGTTSFITDLSSAVSNYWVDCDLIWLSGSLAGQRKRVIAYDGGTKKISVFGGFTSAPANGDKFCLVNH